MCLIVDTLAHNKSSELTLDRVLPSLLLRSSPSRSAQLQRYVAKASDRKIAQGVLD